MALYLIRHGQTDWNLAKRLQSHTDIPLNDTGREQARRVGEALQRKAVSFDKALSSPLGRAQETAQIALNGLDVSLETAPDLLEISLGDYEGQSETELAERLGERYHAWRAKCFTEPAPNGESIFKAIVRAGRALDMLIGARFVQNQIVIGHQGINMAIMARLSGRTDLESLADYRQANDQVEVWDTVAGQRIERFSIG